MYDTEAPLGTSKCNNNLNVMPWGMSRCMLQLRYVCTAYDYIRTCSRRA